MKKIVFMLAAALISVSSLKAQKAEAGWQKIGETSVDFKSDKGVIPVAGADAFKAIRIKATDAPVHIESLSVVYQDGEPEAIPVRYDFKEGEQSRAINLKGNQRKIKEIDFVYRTVPNTKGDKSTVEIWGSK